MVGSENFLEPIGSYFPRTEFLQKPRNRTKIEPRTECLGLPLTPPSLSPCGRDPDARMRTSTPRPQDPRRVVRPICQPPSRHAPSPSARAVPHDSLNIHLKHEIFATWNSWMQHKSEADETIRTYNYNISVKHMQHLDKTLATWKHLLQRKNKTTETFEIFPYTICVKLIQHLDKKTIATYV
jgi:hypothetical protein